MARLRFLGYPPIGRLEYRAVARYSGRRSSIVVAGVSLRFARRVYGSNALTEASPRKLHCLSVVQTSVSTTPLALEPNLRTNLDPAGLLRDQSLATTTNTHRQLAVFPNLLTCHDPRNNWQPSLPRWLRGPPTHSPSPRDIAFSEGVNGFPRRSR